MHPTFLAELVIRRHEAYHDGVVHARGKGNHSISVQGRPYVDQSAVSLQWEAYHEREFLQHLRDPIWLRAGSKVAEENAREMRESVARLADIREEMARRRHTPDEGFEPTTDPPRPLNRWRS